MEIEIDNEKILLEEVAQNGNNKLYRMESDERVVGADGKEIMKYFPDYKFEPFETFNYTFFIEEDGVMKFYWPDGTPYEFEDDDDPDLEN